MDRRNLIKARAASALFAGAAAAMLIAACILPQMKLNKLKSYLEPRARAAIEMTQTSETEKAQILILEMAEKTNAEKSVLLMLFDHDGVTDLCHALSAASELAEAGDKAQLLAELTAVLTELERLYATNEASLENLI